MKRVEAVLLDCDGVIAASEQLNFECWREVVARTFGVDRVGDWRRIVGLDAAETLACLLDGSGIRAEPGSIDLGGLLESKNRLYAGRAPGELQAIPGTVEFREWLRSLALPCAVVSASLRRRLLTTLSALGLADSFDAVFPGEMVLEGEPKRKDYRVPGRELGVGMDAVLIVEDSPSGIAAACRAGAGRVWGLATTHSAEALAAAGAHRVFESLESARDAALLGWRDPK